MTPPLARSRPFVIPLHAVAVPLSFLLVALAGCSGPDRVAAPVGGPGAAVACEPDASTMHRTIVSESGEHNVSTTAGSMSSSSYKDVRWLAPQEQVHVEVEATWDDDLPPERMQVRVEDEEGATAFVVAAGPSPIRAAFTVEPTGSAMRVFMDLAPDGDGASVLLAERVTEVRVFQTTLCP